MRCNLGSKAEVPDLQAQQQAYDCNHKSKHLQQASEEPE